MFSYLPLLLLLGKYSSLIAEEKAIWPDEQIMVNEATPHVQALIQLWQSHLATIEAQQRLGPAIQAFVAEATPLMQSNSYQQLLLLLTRYRTLLMEEQKLFPDESVVLEEATPHVTALADIWHRHLATIQRQEALAPQIKQFLDDAVPIIAAAR